LGNTVELDNWLNSNGGADACGNVTWTNDFTGMTTSCGSSGSVTVVFTATDECNNTATTGATFTIQDTQAPLITTTASDYTAECDGLGNTVELDNWLNSNGGADAADACGNVTWTNDFTGMTTSCGSSGSVTVVFTATDECNNTATTGATFYLNDTTAPNITTPATSLMLFCDNYNNSTDLADWLSNNGNTDADDTCGSVNWTNDFSGFGSNCAGDVQVLVTFTATDACGNSATTSATVTLAQDVYAPDINTPASDLTVECDGLGNTSDLSGWLNTGGGADASDACNTYIWGNDFTGLTPGCGNTGSAIVTFTTTDACGNTATTSAIFTIEDTMAPDIFKSATDETVECDGLGNNAALNDWLAANGNANVIDACSAVSWSNNFSVLSDLCGATGSATVVFMATDECGNTATTGATFTIQDTTPPAISTPASNLSVTCNGAGNTADLNNWLANHAGAVASDACGSVTWSHDFTALTPTCGGSTGSATVTFTATDECGNTATTGATFTIIDTTPPVISIPASNANVQCNGTGNLSSLNLWLSLRGGALATDNCSAVTWTNNFTGITGCGAAGSATVIFTATDACGNTATTSATFNIIDTVAPNITTPASGVSVVCDGQGNTTDLNNWLNSRGGANATDICSAVTWTNNFTVLTPSCGAAGSATVIFTATDACGNTSTTSATFTITSSVIPSINTQAQDLSVACDGLGNTVELTNWLSSNGGAAANDACGNVTWTNDYTNLTSGCGNTGSATVIFTATDACGNTATTSATFTIEDNLNPTITTQAQDLSVACDGLGNTVELTNWLSSNGGADANDACGNVTWTNDYTNLTSGCGNTGSATVIFTATDACGNTTTTSATFTIEDNLNPTITTQAQDLSVACDGLGNTVELTNWLSSNGGADADDACGNVTWTNDYTNLTSACGNTGSATVIFTATDACGNTATTSATFTIEDTTDPTITTAAQDYTAECDGLGNTVELTNWLSSNGGADANDACGNVTWTNDYTNLTSACGNTGSATVIFTATDACGNTATTSATFTIEDNLNPTITTQAQDLSVACDGLGNTVELTNWLSSNGGADANDACGNVTWTNDYTNLTSGCGNTGSATVIFTATDACGNTTTTSATFTIEDNLNPTITTQAQDLSVACDGLGNTVELTNWLSSNGGADADDACGNVTWTNDYTALTSACGNTGSATVIFTATDACGNTATTSATFTIDDTTDPNITTAAQDYTAECDGLGNTVELTNWLSSNGGASADDACGNVTWTNDYTALTSACGNTGSATVIFTATDACGNTATTSATFTIEDNLNPTITTQAQDLSVACDGLGNTVELTNWLSSNGGAAANDACGNVTWTNDYTNLTSGCGNTGSATVIFTATDACGNTATTSATFTIEDNTPPTIDVSASDMFVECDGNGNNVDINMWLATHGGATASDNCGNVIWGHNFTGLNGCGFAGSATVVFTATDACGNTATTSATFTIEDTTPPVITIPADNGFAECEGLTNTALNAWLTNNGGAMATDICGAITWTNDYNGLDNIICGLSGTVVVTFMAKDACGNTSTTAAQFTIEDTTPPVIDQPAQNIVLECDGNGNIADITNWLAGNGGAMASDACGSLTWINDYAGLSSGCGSTGSALVTFTVKDECGNPSSTQATVTILDTSPPVATGTTPGVDIEGVNLCGSSVQVGITAGCTITQTIAKPNWSDNCSVISQIFAPTVTNGGTASNAPGFVIATLNAGTTVVTFAAADLCGNTGYCTVTVIATDNSTPVIVNCPANPVVISNTPNICSGTPFWLPPMVSDNCTGASFSSVSAVSPAGSNTPYNGTVAPGAIFPVGSYTITYLATDGGNNTAACSFDVIINDVQAPVISQCPTTQTLQGCNISALPNYSPVLTASTLAAFSNVGGVASDNCSITGVTYQDNAQLGQCGSTVIRTWIVTDAAGLTASCTQTIQIADTEAPTLSGIPNAVSVSCGNIPMAAAVTATDICDIAPIVTVSDVSTQTNNGSCTDFSYTITRTWTATDACDNSSSASQTITVTDTEAPTLSGIPDAVSVSCGNIPMAAAVTATDNCDTAPIVTVSDISTQTNNGSCTDYNYTITRTWTATDACGNSNSASQTITVTDTEAPTLSGVPVDVTVSCDNIPLPNTVTAQDNCDPNPFFVFNEVSTQTNTGTCTDYSYTITRSW